ncbi:MAG TPA: protein kinase [Thermoanaerobaculia bacterium]|nr:protein kinase [Thermoanaerobaculia bacterium]
MDPAPERRLGTYRLIARIGAGGMGEVWRAEDPRLGREVAIKILSPALANDPEYRARFAREARTVAQLYHPNIATIHAIEKDGDRPFIVMELVTGESLGAVMKRRPLNENEICAIGARVADALAEAHSKGIVHRDIKPDNIVVSGEKVKVLDFGIAKRVGPPGGAAHSASGFITEAGMIVGTVHYMSPEQALGKPLDARTDIYSLGVVLFEALTGRLPFQGETLTDVLTRIIRDEMPRIRDLSPLVSPGLEGIIERTLTKDREARFQSAGDLAAALDRQRTSASAVFSDATTAAMPTATEPVRVVSSGRDERGGRKGIAIAATIVIAAIITVAAVLRWQGQRPELPAVEAPASVPDRAAAPPAGEAAAADDPKEARPVETPVAAPVPDALPVSIVEDVPGQSVAETKSASDERAQRAYKTGLDLLARGNRLAAAIAFREALAADPQMAPARLKIAQMLLLRRDFAAAERELLIVLESAERLSAREKLLADLGLAIAQRRRDDVEAFAARFDAAYPGDPELEIWKRELAIGAGERRRRDVPARQKRALQNRPGA